MMIWSPVHSDGPALMGSGWVRDERRTEAQPIHHSPTKESKAVIIMRHGEPPEPVRIRGLGAGCLAGRGWGRWRGREWGDGLGVDGGVV